MINVRPKVKRPELNDHDLQAIDNLEEPLKQHVMVLADEIGERNLFLPKKLDAAAQVIRLFWEEMGHHPKVQEYKAQDVTCRNLTIEIKGNRKPGEILIIGAHYDSIQGSPGANDNGSGVAALLEISRMFGTKPRNRTLRFVAFANEEPPFFQEPDMGSLVYAKQCREDGDNIVGMVCLETIGYFNDKPGSQEYPPPLGFFYPDRGNFIAVVGNTASRKLVRTFTEHFMGSVDFPVECIATFESIPGIDWSDHGSFWRYGYPAIMLTDTAPFRYPHYHLAGDTPDQIHYPSLAKVVYGTYGALSKMVDSSMDL